MAIPDKKKIIEALKNKPLTLTELSLALGYKGITSKLTKTVNDMIAGSLIEKIAGERNTNKLMVRQ